MGALNDVIPDFRAMGEEILRNVWLPTLKEVKNNPNVNHMLADCPRSSEGVKNRKVKNGFIIDRPGVWGGFNPAGGTFPLGGTYRSEEQSIELASFAGTAMISLQTIMDNQDQANAWGDLLQEQLNTLVKTLPAFRKALFYSPYGSKAIGKVVSISGTTVTLDNAGLWGTATVNRAMLFESGMYVQWYRAGVKVGVPTRIQDVDYVAGKVVVSADPGLADNDYAVPTDAGGFTDTHNSLYYGILDVLDDDNTFQALDRSAAGAPRALKAYIESASGKTFNYALLSDFFRRLKSPKKAYTHPDLISNYWLYNIASNVRYDASVKKYMNGFQALEIDGTMLVGDDDGYYDRVIVPNYEMSDIMIKTSGAPRDPFGLGWHQVGRDAVLEQNMVFDEQLVCLGQLDKSGVLHTITARTS